MRPLVQPFFLVAWILPGISLFLPENLFAFVRNYLTGQEIIQKTLENERAENQVDIVKMVTLDASGDTRIIEVLRLFHNGTDGRNLAHFRILAPEEIRGTALLTIQNADGSGSQHTFLPGINARREIRGRGRKGPFLGTDFSYEDFLHENSLKFEYERDVDEVVDGITCYRIIARPKADFKAESGYSYRELWISHDDFRLLKINFYDPRKRLQKSLLLTEFVSTDERLEAPLQPKRAMMKNLQRETSSLMVRTAAVYDHEIPPSDFSVENLSTWTEEDYQRYIRLLK